jgi:hypothetical protein
MAIQVGWDNEEKTAIRYDFEAYWSWNDFFTAFQTSKSLIDTAPGNVGVIFDASIPNLHFPPNLLSHLKNALQNRHPKTRIIVVVIKNPFLRAIVQSLMKIGGKDGKLLHIATTVEDARKQVRDCLKNVPPTDQPEPLTDGMPQEE